MSVRISADVDALGRVVGDLQLDHDAVIRAAADLESALVWYRQRCPEFGLGYLFGDPDLSGHVDRSRQLAEQFALAARQLATAGAVGELGAIWQVRPTDFSSGPACPFSPDAQTLARHRALELLGTRVVTSTSQTFNLSAGVTVGVADVGILEGLGFVTETLSDGRVEVTVVDMEGVEGSIGGDFGRVAATLGASVTGSNSFTMRFANQAEADAFLRAERLPAGIDKVGWLGAGLLAAGLGIPLGMLGVSTLRELFDKPPKAAVRETRSVEVDLTGALDLDLRQVKAGLGGGLSAMVTKTTDREGNTTTEAFAVAFAAVASAQTALADKMGGLLAGVLPSVDRSRTGELEVAITRDGEGRPKSLVITTLVGDQDSALRTTRVLDLQTPGREDLAAALPHLEGTTPAVAALGAAWLAHAPARWDTVMEEDLERSDSDGVTVEAGAVSVDVGGTESWKVTDTRVNPV